MKLKLIFILSLLIIALYSKSHAGDYETLMQAIIKVESNGNRFAIGDNGKALGILQLHSIMVEDYNRIYKTNYIHQDALNPDISKKIFVGICEYYDKVIINQTGKPATNQQLAYVWNFGPKGYKYVNPYYGDDSVRKNLEKYWKKVLTKL